MYRHVRPIALLSTLLLLMSSTGCAWIKGVTADGTSEGVPKDAKLVAESAGTVGIFEAETDGTLYIVNSHAARKRADVLVYTGPVVQGQVLKIDTTGPQDATLDGKSLGLKLAGGTDVTYRVYFGDSGAGGMLAR